MPKRRNNADQHLLDFGTAEGAHAGRLAAFRAKLDAILPEVVGVSDAQWGNLWRLLESVHYFTDGDPSRYAAPAPTALVENADLSKSVISRTRQQAVDLGLLRYQRPRVRRGQRRPPDRLWIHHDEIGRLAEASRRLAGSGGNSRDQVGSGGIRWDHSKEPPSPPLHLSNPPPSSPSAPAADGSPYADAAPGGWGDLVEELRGLGVGCADTVWKVPRDAGATPEEALRVVTAWREGQRVDPPAWGVGLLVTKLKKLRPGAAVEFPRSEELERLTESVAREKRRQQEVVAWDAEQREKESRAADRAAEQQAGEEWLARLRAAAKALPADELDRLIAGLDPFPRRLATRDRFGDSALLALADRLQPVTV